MHEIYDKASVGLAKAALEAINGFNLFGNQGCSWSVIFVDLDAHNRNRQTLCSLLPRESRSHNTDAALLPTISYPAFAVDDDALYSQTLDKIVRKLRGKYGFKRFLRDGYRTANEDKERRFYKPAEMKAPSCRQFYPEAGRFIAKDDAGPRQFSLAQEVPPTQQALRLHRNTMTMELVWLQQAIDSRKKYLAQMAASTAATALLPPVKSVVVYKNGDPFYSGRRFVVNQRQVASMEAFLTEVTRSIGASLAVRTLYTPRQGHRVSDLQDLQTGANVFRNGDLLCPPFRFIIPRSMQQDLEQILSLVTEKVSLRTGAVRRLCSLEGATLSSAVELETGHCYVAVGTERFKKLPYVELLVSKATERTGKQEVVQRISTVTQPSSTPQRPVKIRNNRGQPRPPLSNGSELTLNLSLIFCPKRVAEIVEDEEQNAPLDNTQQDPERQQTSLKSRPSSNTSQVESREEKESPQVAPSIQQNTTIIRSPGEFIKESQDSQKISK
ncbi:hypothetical protein JOQ06_028318 [Pogonophryne albipinna]|uniref:Phosphorylase b kinase regulatory subunit n=1 Tax=Pogonophryne albipinna TaxID=1090488 RepID=A0AAD6B8Q8_9TELE|nr:hypothetical protein JOQ06_028318 [Pogonophryne albipinna]